MVARHITAFHAKYGPWAVVAGAWEGLGAEYATQLAARDLNLVLIARRRAMLESLAAQLQAEHGIATRLIELDLAREDCGAVVAAATAELDVGLLVYNAARSVIGPFLDQPLADHLTEIAVNCRAPLSLAYALGQRLSARGRGGIILMSSLSATMGSAIIANYAATKAYNMIFAEGLWEELRGRGVDVLASCAGAVRTPNYMASAPHGNGGAMAPGAVVAQTLAALGKRPSVIPGLSNRLSAFALRRLMPRATMITIMGRVMRGMYGAKPEKATP